MIDLYTWETSNGRKASVMLEECGLPYRAIAVDIDHGEQHLPAWQDLLPAGRIPAMVDHDPLPADGPGPVHLFESGAILLYLAGRSGRFLPASGRARSECLQWFAFGLSTFGPLLQQLHWFNRRPGPPVEAAVDRYAAEARRLYGILERRLASSPWVGGAEYGIADIAAHPWVARHEWQRITLAAYPHVQRWFDTVAERPAVRRGYAVPQR